MCCPSSGCSTPKATSREAATAAGSRCIPARIGRRRGAVVLLAAARLAEPEHAPMAALTRDRAGDRDTTGRVIRTRYSDALAACYVWGMIVA